MPMIYASLAPLVAAAILILLVPGLLLAWATGVRGWVLAGSAGPASVTLISVSAILAGFAGLPWNILVVLAVSVLLAVAIFAVRRLWPSSIRRRGTRSGRTSRNWNGIFISWLAMAAVFAVLFWRLGQVFGGPENISQTFDNIFHLNAVRYIVDTGNASSLRVSGFTASNGIGGFYPAAWHDVVSLTQQLTGSTIPAAVNATNIAIGGLIWPLSCVLLATSLFGRRRTVVVSSCALAAGFSAFPFLMVDFGVLYPNLLSIAMLPACIALLALALRVARGLALPPGSAWILLLGALPGLALAHPSTLLAFFAWTYPAVLAAGVAAFRLWRPRFGARPTAATLLIALIVYTGVLTIGWKVLRPDEAQSTWQPVQTLSQAFGQALTSSPQGRPIPWLIFALTLLGIWALLRQRRHLWLLAMFVVSGLMFIIVSGYPFGSFRTWFGGVWYNDPFRLAALLPVATLPVAVFGAAWLADLLRGFLHDRLTARKAPVLREWVSGTRAKTASVILSVLALCGLFVLSQGGAVSAAVRSAASNYAVTSDSPLVSRDEMTLLRRAGSEIPADNVVVSSPWTGASMVYAISDRKSLTPHVFGEYDASTIEILRQLNHAGETPEVCDAVRKLKAYYVLDFGTREVHGGHHEFPGVQNLEINPGFRLIDSEGPAKLYKVSACGA